MGSILCYSGITVSRDSWFWKYCTNALSLRQNPKAEVTTPKPKSIFFLIYLLLFFQKFDLRIILDTLPVTNLFL